MEVRHGDPCGDRHARVRSGFGDVTRTVIVGAGAAGAPLAARLSEDPDREVILVEAGRADGRYPAELRDGSTVQGAMPGHPANWGYTGELTPDLPYTIARGRIAGGSSTINGGYFVRATQSDFDRWAIVGGAHWRYEHASGVLAAIETDRDVGEREGHGASGPMPVVRPPQTNPAARAFIAAARSHGFPFESDKNATGVPGVGPVPSTVVSGLRVNTGLAYLEPIRDRANLRIIGERTVQRVRFSGTRALGVDTDGEPIDADEVVLCAGAIGSAQLLLVSGVGPAAQLREQGIGVVADLPVGESFSDHPDIAVGWLARVPVADPAERFAFPTALNFDAAGRKRAPGDLELLLAVKPLGYLLTGSHRTVAAGAASALRHPVRFARSMRGTSARRAMTQLAHGDDLQLIVGLQAPDGRGRLSLTGPTIATHPRIEYRYLEAKHDRQRMRVGIRTAVELLRSDAFAGVFDRLTELDAATLADDSALDGWMRAHLGTAIHMCGTAPMGAVVDGDGVVHGVTGLRVADTSILPDVPHRGPYATAVYIGEMLGRRMRDGTP